MNYDCINSMKVKSISILFCFLISLLKLSNIKNRILYQSFRFKPILFYTSPALKYIKGINIIFIIKWVY